MKCKKLANFRGKKSKFVSFPIIHWNWIWIHWNYLRLEIFFRRTANCLKEKQKKIKINIHRNRITWLQSIEFKMETDERMRETLYPQTLTQTHARALTHTHLFARKYKIPAIQRWYFVVKVVVWSVHFKPRRNGTPHVQWRKTEQNKFNEKGNALKKRFFVVSYRSISVYSAHPVQNPAIHDMWLSVRAHNSQIENDRVSE